MNILKVFDSCLFFVLINFNNDNSEKLNLYDVVLMKYLLNCVCIVNVI